MANLDLGMTCDTLQYKVLLPQDNPRFSRSLGDGGLSYDHGTQRDDFFFFFGGADGLYPCRSMGTMAHKEIPIRSAQPVESWFSTENTHSGLYSQRPTVVEQKRQPSAGQAHDHVGCKSQGLECALLESACSGLLFMS